MHRMTGWSCPWLLAALLFGAALAAAQRQQTPQSQQRTPRSTDPFNVPHRLPPPLSVPGEKRTAYLRAVQKKLLKDAARLAELAAVLREEAWKRKEQPLTAAEVERVDKLEGEAKSLRALLAQVDENLLSAEALLRADAIENEADALKEEWKRSPVKNLLAGLIKTAAEMEKRADSIGDRMRWPVH